MREGGGYIRCHGRWHHTCIRCRGRWNHAMLFTGQSVSAAIAPTVLAQSKPKVLYLLNKSLQIEWQLIKSAMTSHGDIKTVIFYILATARISWQPSWISWQPFWISLWPSWISWQPSWISWQPSWISWQPS